MLERLKGSRLYVNLHQHEIVRQFVKYAIVGVLNVAASLGIFNGLRVLNVHRLGASAIAFVLTSVNGFVLNKMWSFRDRSADRVTRQYFKFVFFTAIGLGLFTAVFRLLLIPLEQHGRLGENVAFLASVPVSVLWNFTSYRYWTFNRPARASSF
jgi:putative flippase GtrA